ncbi:amino acid adenylation domain-containing protein [Streptomyces sp. HNM0645]|uniref:non-ribosomal peptide synthetase n=1 Tax=Streptomyces sp. HNM0645 TaxID=2782343 RepID=UPI0024B7B82D|nr:amino acid adenylation domain-containing protein [Streptomyces sp. HNM0645]MDI9886740.1 amino acid adenylation domain-containing protein [Streptomyces sp. HNM0645]
MTTRTAASEPAGQPVLSFAQERLWFLDQLSPGESGYLTPFSRRLDGPVDADLLERALRAVAERHPVLRSRIDATGGRPVPVTEAATTVRLERTDLSGELEPERAAEDAIRTMLNTPMDLRVAPWLRASLFRLGEGRFLFHVQVHHIAFDGVSRGVFERELSAQYRALAGGRPAPALPPGPDYAAHAARQRASLTAAERERLLAHWRSALDSAPHVLELPSDRPRPARPGPRAGRVDFRIPEEVTSALYRVAEAHRTTLFCVGLAAYQHLLGRYADVRDVLVGVPFAGREDPAVEQVIGFFTHSVPLRGELGGSPSLDDLTQQARDRVLEALDHQELPLDQLVDGLGVTREANRNPLFQHWFDLADPELDRPALILPGVRVRPVPVAETTTRFDTELHLRPSGTELAGRLLYSADLFGAETAERLAGHYAALLAAAAAEPGRPLDSIPLTGDGAERAQLLDLGTGPAVRRGPATVGEYVDRTVARIPDEVAVSHGGRRLTYRQLDQQSRRIARVVRERGAGPERVVAVCLPRGPELVCALVGVVRSGAAYLPVDPEHPAERVAYLLRDSGATAVLGDAGAERLTGVIGDRLVRVDELLDADFPDDGAAESTAEHVVEDPAAALDPDRLLYVVYTSGSTGLPKGVGVTHRTFTRLLDWHLDRYPVAAGVATAQTAGVSFDAAAWEIWPALASGSRLEVCSADEVRTPSRLLDRLVDSGTGMVFVPTALAELLIREPLDRRTPLRRLLTGGDVFRPRAGDSPGIPVFNHYGPTENTVVATATDALARPWPGRSIGRPIAGVRAYVLDDRLNLVPRGVRGELWLGGALVSRGYLGRAGLTAERFAPDPFATEPGARMYRTGDLVRWLTDGTLEFRGRADGQLKISGYRVEPAEVEVVLLRCPGVREAVVTAAAGADGAPVLVAYLVCGSPGPSDAELRSRLRREVPSYLVPSVFVHLDGLPLTVTGKIDRRALPAPSVARARATVVPRTAAESAVHGLWLEVLPGHAPGVEDDFFASGGTSLSAARLSVRVREVFGIDFPVRAVFDFRTVAEQCAAIEELVLESVSNMTDSEISAALNP